MSTFTHREHGHAGEGHGSWARPVAPSRSGELQRLGHVQRRQQNLPVDVKKQDGGTGLLVVEDAGLRTTGRSQGVDGK